VPARASQSARSRLVELENGAQGQEEQRQAQDADQRDAVAQRVGAAAAQPAPQHRQVNRGWVIAPKTPGRVVDLELAGGERIARDDVDARLVQVLAGRQAGQVHQPQNRAQQHERSQGLG
jgi:hypothetical protein